MKESVKHLAIGGASGAVGTGIAEVGFNLDKNLNPQVFTALQQHMETYQLLTTNHSWTVLFLDNQPLSTAVTFGICALWGYIYSRVKG